MSSPEEEVPKTEDQNAPAVEDVEDSGEATEENDESISGESAEESENEGSDEADEPTPLDPNAVVVYDFEHPSHKLNSRLPVLDVINEKIATGIAKALSTQFHQAIEVKPVAPSFEKFESYASSLPDSVSINRFRIDPLNGNAMMILDGDLIFMMVDSFFGGVDALSEPLGQRSFTPTELRITERIRDNIFSAMKAAWLPVMPLELSFETQLTSTEFTSPAHPSAVVVCSRYEVELKAGKGHIDILIPYSVLEPIRSKLTTDLQKMSEKNREWQRDFSRQVLECETDIEGVFAESKISVRQLMNLQVGDFIPLGKVQSVDFSAEGIPLFEAAVGVSNGMVSASVRKWHDRKRTRR